MSDEQATRIAALEKQVADLKAEIESGDLGDHYKWLHAAHRHTEERRAALEKVLRRLCSTTEKALDLLNPPAFSEATAQQLLSARDQIMFARAELAKQTT